MLDNLFEASTLLFGTYQSSPHRHFLLLSSIISRLTFEVTSAIQALATTEAWGWDAIF